MLMRRAADRHTLAQVLINGEVAGFFERSNPRNLPLPNIFGDLGPNEEVHLLLGLCNCMMPNITNTVSCIIFMRGTVMVGACSEMKRFYICNLVWPQQGCKDARSCIQPSLKSPDKACAHYMAAGDAGHFGGGPRQGQLWLRLGLQGPHIARHQAQWCAAQLIVLSVKTHTQYDSGSQQHKF